MVGPRGRNLLGAVVAGGLLAGLLAGLLSGYGYVAAAAGTGGTDPAAGAFAGLGGPASARLPGALPGNTGNRADDRSGSAAGDPSAAVPARVPSPAPIPPTAPPQVPRQSAALAAQPAPVSAPVRVRADSLGIDMPIEAVGLADAAADSTAMALPENPAVAAWYRYGSGPGSAAGATVVAAHVDSLVYDLGPFAKLADAPVGTEIVVETADGGAHVYSVASVESQQKPEVPWGSVFDRSGQPRLTLVTCGGEFDYDARRYLSNVIVTAVPVT